MLNEGTTVRSCSARSVLPWLTKSSLRMTSIGTAEAVTDRGWARVPTTTTCSASPPTAISTSRATVAPPRTSTTCAGAVKPERVNVTAYVPGASPLNVNWPVPSVTVTCALPAASCASTVTPGRMPPVVSVDRASDRRVLGAGHAGRKHADGKHQHQRKAYPSVVTQFQRRALLVARGFIGHIKIGSHGTARAPHLP